MATRNRGQRNDNPRPRRRVHPDGVIEEWGPTGRTFTIPSNPRRDDDVSVDAFGWEPFETFLRRLHRR